MKKILWGIAAFLIAVGFGILGRDERKAKKAGQQRDDLLLDGSGRAKAKAHKAGIRADRHQEAAKKAKVAAELAIDRVGKNDETVASILDSWRKPDGV